MLVQCVRDFGSEWSVFHLRVGGAVEMAEICIPLMDPIQSGLGLLGLTLSFVAASHLRGYLRGERFFLVRDSLIQSPWLWAAVLIGLGLILLGLEVKNTKDPYGVAVKPPPAVDTTGSFLILMLGCCGLITAWALGGCSRNAASAPDDTGKKIVAVRSRQ